MNVKHEIARRLEEAERLREEIAAQAEVLNKPRERGEAWDEYKRQADRGSPP